MADVAHVGGGSPVGDMAHVVCANQAVGVLLEHLGKVIVLPQGQVAGDGLDLDPCHQLPLRQPSERGPP